MIQTTNIPATSTVSVTPARELDLQSTRMLNEVELDQASGGGGAGGGVVGMVR